MKTEAETGVIWPQVKMPRNIDTLRKLEEVRKDSPLEPPTI